MTTSTLIVRLKDLVTSWFCASDALIVKAYVVLDGSTAAVPDRVPSDESVVPSGNEPENKLYVIGASPVATTDALIGLVSYTVPKLPEDVDHDGPEDTLKFK